VAAGHVVAPDAGLVVVKVARTDQAARHVAALKYRPEIAGALAPETQIA